MVSFSSSGYGIRQSRSRRQHLCISVSYRGGSDDGELQAAEGNQRDRDGLASSARLAPHGRWLYFAHPAGEEKLDRNSLRKPVPADDCIYVGSCGGGSCSCGFSTDLSDDQGRL